MIRNEVKMVDLDWNKAPKQQNGHLLLSTFTQRGTKAQTTLMKARVTWGRALWEHGSFGETHIEACNPSLEETKNSNWAYLEPISTPTGDVPTHLINLPDFATGESFGKHRKVDRPLSSIITPKKDL